MAARRNFTRVVTLLMRNRGERFFRWGTERRGTQMIGTPDRSNSDGSRAVHAMDVSHRLCGRVGRVGALTNIKFLTDRNAAYSPRLNRTRPVRAAKKGKRNGQSTGFAVRLEVWRIRRQEQQFKVRKQQELVVGAGEQFLRKAGRFISPARRSRPPEPQERQIAIRWPALRAGHLLEGDKNER
jgi:hypothetical protein